MKPEGLRWLVRADRRAVARAALVSELEALAETIEGLELTLLADYEAARDEGAFRDFAPVATLEAHDRRILEAAAEELLREFGFKVDFKPESDKPESDKPESGEPEPG